MRERDQWIESRYAWSMRSEIVALVRNKLSQSLREFDEPVFEKLRDSLAHVGPAPTCPHIEKVMAVANQVLVKASKERGLVAKDLLVSTLMPLRSKLDSQLIDEVVQVVADHFPLDTYVAFVSSISGKYRARNASSNYFEGRENAISIAIASAAAAAANSSMQSVEAIRTALDELKIQSGVDRPSWWIQLWRLVVRPSVQWLFAIIAAVLVAVLVALLVGK